MHNRILYRRLTSSTDLTFKALIHRLIFLRSHYCKVQKQVHVVTEKKSLDKRFCDRFTQNICETEFLST